MKGVSTQIGTIVAPPISCPFLQYRELGIQVQKTPVYRANLAVEFKDHAAIIVLRPFGIKDLAMYC
ncbi:hypothetical protein ACFL2H_05385, partial [Planctomycetota bacterium]